MECSAIRLCEFVGVGQHDHALVIGDVQIGRALCSVRGQCDIAILHGIDWVSPQVGADGSGRRQAFIDQKLLRLLLSVIMEQIPKDLIGTLHL